MEKVFVVLFTVFAILIATSASVGIYAAIVVNQDNTPDIVIPDVIAVKGDTGDTGAVGSVGDTGATGATGTNGVDGLDASSSIGYTNVSPAFTSAGFVIDTWTQFVTVWAAGETADVSVNTNIGTLTYTGASDRNFTIDLSAYAQQAGTPGVLDLGISYNGAVPTNFGSHVLQNSNDSALTVNLVIRLSQGDSITPYFKSNATPNITFSNVTFAAHGYV